MIDTIKLNNGKVLVFRPVHYNGPCKWHLILSDGSPIRILSPLEAEFIECAIDQAHAHYNRDDGAINNSLTISPDRVRAAADFYCVNSNWYKG